jgi:hypothetical protein
MFVRGNVLMAQRDDPASLTLAGEAVAITENLSAGANADSGMFTASANGRLVYRTGEVGGNRQIT